MFFSWHTAPKVKTQQATEAYNTWSTCYHTLHAFPLYSQTGHNVSALFFFFSFVVVVVVVVVAVVVAAPSAADSGAVCRRGGGGGVCMFLCLFVCFCCCCCCFVCLVACLSASFLFVCFFLSLFFCLNVCLFFVDELQWKFHSTLRPLYLSACSASTSISFYTVTCELFLSTEVSYKPFRFCLPTIQLNIIFITPIDKPVRFSPVVSISTFAN